MISRKNTGDAFIKASDQDGDVLNLGAYDVDGTVDASFIQLTAGNTPTLVIAPPASGGTVSIRASTYKSSDDSTGATTSITTANLVGKTITVKNGLITAFA